MQSAAQAYARTARTGLTGRDLESTLLRKLAGDLEQSCRDSEVEIAAFHRALSDNRRLWAMFASDATEPESALPEDLRSDVVGFAAFVFKQTHAALIDPTPERVGPLVRLNRILAEGLAAPVAQPAQPAPGGAGSFRSA